MKEILSRTATLVLAGGRGQRLGPLTSERSKPAVPFGDRTVIDYVLQNCLQSNLVHPFILTQYRSAHLAQHVRRWWLRQRASMSDAFATPVCVPAPETEYVGTANALLRNLKLLSPDTKYVLVLSADHIYEMEYGELLRFHVESGADATLSAIVNPSRSSQEFGILQVDSADRVLGFEEKPRIPKELPGQPGRVLANMGIYVFSKETLIDALLSDAADQSSAHDIGHNVLPKLVASKEVKAFRFEDPQTRQPRYWKDVGTIDSYYQASMEWLRKLPSSHLLSGSRSVICDGARVHHTAEVIDSVLMPGVVVGTFARVRSAILDENAYVMPGAAIGFGSEDDSSFERTPGGVVVVPARAIVSVTRGSRRVTRLNHLAPTLEGVSLQR